MPAPPPPRHDGQSRRDRPLRRAAKAPPRAGASGRARKPRLDASAWIDAALDALAEGGVHALRVERLAVTLGVTKGSFYWHFADRRALLDALLAHWRDGREASIRRQSAGAEPAPVILRRLADLFTTRANYRGLAIEIAIRAFARRDRKAADAIRAVDAVRLAHVAGLFRGLGWPPRAARTRAVLFYAYLFGQPLLHAASASPARRREAVDAVIAPPR